MAEIRIIKKYPNRRLYDCEDSCYITRENLRRLAVAGTEFKVLENDSGKDITAAMLLQIVTEQEQGGAALLGNDFLLQLIRFYGGPMSTQVRGYLEECLKLCRDPAPATNTTE